MFNQTILSKSFQENDPYALQVHLMVTGLHDTKRLTPELFLSNENDFLKILERSKNSFLSYVFLGNDKYSVWKKCIHLLFPIISTQSQNDQWIDVIKKHFGYSEMVFFATDCVYADNTALLARTCQLMQTHETGSSHHFESLLNESIRFRKFNVFSYMFSHLVNNTNASVIDRIISRCVIENFKEGIEFIISKTSEDVLKKVYSSNRDFKELAILRYPNDASAVLLEHSLLQSIVSVQVWKAKTTEMMKTYFEALCYSHIYFWENLSKQKSTLLALFNHSRSVGHRIDVLCQILLKTEEVRKNNVWNDFWQLCDLCNEDEIKNWLLSNAVLLSENRPIKYKELLDRPNFQKQIFVNAISNLFDGTNEKKSRKI